MEIAAKLAANSSVSVALVEAGGYFELSIILGLQQYKPLERILLTPI